MLYYPLSLVILIVAGIDCTIGKSDGPGSCVAHKEAVKLFYFSRVADVRISWKKKNQYSYKWNWPAHSISLGTLLSLRHRPTCDARPSQGLIDKPPQILFVYLCLASTRMTLLLESLLGSHPGSTGSSRCLPCDGNARVTSLFWPALLCHVEPGSVPRKLLSKAVLHPEYTIHPSVIITPPPPCDLANSHYLTRVISHVTLLTKFASLSLFITSPA